MLFAMFLGCHLAIVVSFFLIARKNNIQLGFYFDSLIIFYHSSEFYWCFIF